MKYYLGVDGGGTKTTAAAADENGNIVARAHGKTINYYSNPYEAAKRNFKEIIDKIDIYDYASVVIGMSALSETADAETANDFVNGILRSEKLLMTSDVEIALNSAECDTARAVLICGTGSMAAAVDNSGNRFHAGGWGYLLGDGGSGYSVALNAAKRTIKDIEENKKDVLTDEFKAFFKVNTENEILERFYDPPIRRDGLAAFAGKVFKAYACGSTTAAEVIENEAEQAAALAKRILSRLPGNSPLFLYGGLFENNPVYIDLLNRKAGIKAELLPLSPVIGALSMAGRNDGHAAASDFYKNIKKK